MQGILTPFTKILSSIWHWLRHSRYAGALSILIAVGLVYLAQVKEYHKPFISDVPSNIEELPKGWEAPPDQAHLYLYLLPYLRLIVLLGGVVYHIYIIRAYPRVEKMIFPTWLACGGLLIWALASQFYGQWEAQQLSWDGEVFSSTAFFAQVGLLAGLLISPPLALMYYSRCKIMERYVIRTFMMPLVFCFVAFCMLWIVMDLINNLPDYQKNNIKMSQVAVFYIKLVPFIYVTVAPITLLLATVYTLGRMSRTNELISMFGAGKSMVEVLRPIYLAGIYASFLSMAANYHWAPVSEGNKEKLLEDVSERINQNVLVQGLMYRNMENNRTWFVGQVPSSLRQDRMRRLEIRQEDEQGKLTKAWFAKSAFWWPDAKTWSFYGGVEVNYANGQVESIKNFDFDGTGFSRMDSAGWPETPWVLLSGSLTPDFLGVPDLLSYLVANNGYTDAKLAPFWTHFYYRFALPWHCFVVVLFAAPLSVVFSRRGLVGGITSAVLFFLALIFMDNLFLNLGKGQHLNPALAVWLPHIILGTLGLYLFLMRSQNRELPRFAISSLWEFPLSILAIIRGLFARPVRS